MKYVIALFILLFFTKNITAQLPAIPNDKEIISSPAVAELFSVSENISINSNGELNNQIDLYSIDNKKFSIPITMSYSGSGVRVDESASWVGLGWSIRTGGMIKRVVRGLPDDLYAHYAKSTLTGNPYYSTHVGYRLHNYNLSGTSAEYEDISHAKIDGESDIYYFSFGEIAGSFYFDQNGNIQHNCSEDLEIEYSQATHILSFDNVPTYYSIIEFVITTSGGIKYRFSDYEEVISITGANIYANDNTADLFSIDYWSNAQYPTYSSPQHNTSAWHLSEITSPFSSDTISFGYRKEPVSTISSLSERKYFGYSKEVNQYSGLSEDDWGIQIQYNNSLSITITKKIENITWNEGKIVFDSNHERLDLCGGINNNKLDRSNTWKQISTLTGVLYYIPKTYALSEIKIYDKEEELIKTLSFNYSEFSSEGIENAQESDKYAYYRLKLLSIDINDFDEYYRFEYNEDIDLPFIYSREKDFWGYYNGNNQQFNPNSSSLIPTIYYYPSNSYSTFPYIKYSVYPLNTYNGSVTTLPGVDRNASNQHCQANILKTIHFPTGGFETYQYELNRFTYDNTTYEGAGLRINSISKNPIQDNPITVNFQYCDELGNDAGYPVDNLNFANYHWTYGDNRPPSLNLSPEEELFYSLQIISGNMSDQNTSGPVSYSKIIKTTGNGSTEYYFNHQATAFDKELDFDFENSLYVYNKSPNYKPFAPNPNYNWKRGKIDSLLIKNESGDVLSAKRYSYSIKEYSKLNMYKSNLNTSWTDYWGPNPPPAYLFSCSSTDYYDLIVNYSIDEEEKTFQYDLNRSITKTTNWEYGDYKLPQNIYNQDSYGNNIKVSIKYPFDYWFDGLEYDLFDLGLYDALPEDTKAIFDLHLNKVKSEPIEVSTFINNKLTNSRFIEYESYAGEGNLELQLPHKIWDSEIDLPLSNFIDSYISPSPYFQLVKDASYGSNQDITHFNNDHGNLIETKKNSNISTSYIWGYNNTLPIAKVDNASSDQVFHSSCEDDPYIDTYNGFYEFDNSKSKTGRFSLKTWDSDAGEDFYRTEIKYPVILQDNMFKYSVWVYSTGPTADLYIFWNNNASAVYNYIGHDHVSTSVTGTWVLLEGEAIIPSGTLKLFLRVDNNNGEGDVWFDDFKFYPADAQMITYTHDPLIGVTSITDPNNQTMHYEYDDFGRLIAVTDSNDDLVQEVEYNYVNQ